MNILLHDFGSYIQPDLIACLSEMGHHCKNLIYPLPNPTEDEYFERYVTAHLNTKQYNCVISTNFQPLLAKICYRSNIKYLAWSYDSPLSQGQYMEYYSYPTSFLFTFDRTDVESLKAAGIENVFHLPLAANTRRLSAIAITESDRKRFCCDISFVGNFYQSPLKRILSCQDNFTIGYINALLDAQLKLPGLGLVDEIIDASLLRQMNNMLAKSGITYHTDEGEGLNKSAFSLCLGSHITRSERIILLRLMNQFCKVHLHSTELVEQLSDIPNSGPVTYNIDMPKVFRLSKINLCPTLRNIRSGIPLRALDIMGAGGFILCNMQPELMDYFRPDIDIACYNNIEDAIDKAKFYLSHDKIRLQIQQNSYAIIQQHFAYPQKVAYMLQVAGL